MTAPMSLPELLAKVRKRCKEPYPEGYESFDLLDHEALALLTSQIAAQISDAYIADHYKELWQRGEAEIASLHAQLAEAEAKLSHYADQNFERTIARLWDVLGNPPYEPGGPDIVERVAAHAKRIAELEALLEPFTDPTEFIRDDEIPDRAFFARMTADNRRLTLTNGHIQRARADRRARAILSTTEKGSG